MLCLAQQGRTNRVSRDESSSSISCAHPLALHHITQPQSCEGPGFNISSSFSSSQSNSQQSARISILTPTKIPTRPSTSLPRRLMCPVSPSSGSLEPVSELWATKTKQALGTEVQLAYMRNIHRWEGECEKVWFSNLIFRTDCAACVWYEICLDTVDHYAGLRNCLATP